MSNEKKISMLMLVNRVCIYVFGLLGIYTDLDIFYIASLSIWVWLPYCVKLERVLYNFIQRVTS